LAAGGFEVALAASAFADAGGDGRAVSRLWPVRVTAFNAVALVFDVRVDAADLDVLLVTTTSIPKFGIDSP